MNICVIGAGALGLLFAGKCSLSNNQIYLITRSSEQSRIISKHGIELLGDHKLHTISVHCSSFDEQIAKRDSMLSNAHIDWIFLMVKQQHINIQMAQFLNSFASSGTKIVCFQNGIGHIETLMEIIPKENLFTAITSEAALRSSPNKVEHTGKGFTSIGNQNVDRTFTGDVEKFLEETLENAGFTVNSSKNINSAVWNKLLINSVINPLTAIFRVRNGELIRSPDWIKVMRALYEEGRDVADELNIEPSESLWDQLIEVCEKTAMNISSMYQDTLKDRPTEIDWINGSIIRIAEQRQLLVPTHRAVYHMIKGMEHPT